MNKVTIETDTEIITGEFKNYDISIGWLEDSDYHLRDMKNVVIKTKKFQWKLCYDKKTSYSIACLDTFDNEKDAVSALKLRLSKNAYRAIFFDKNVLEVPEGKFYIMKVEDFDD